jgi:hypothetical protein
MRKSFLTLMAGVTIWLFSLSGFAQTVVSRIKIGGYSEGTAYVSTGTLAGYTVMLRGSEVVGYQDILTSNKAPKVLFNVISLPVKAQPRGIAYIPGTRRFALADNGQPDRLILCDETGRFAGLLFFQFPDGDPYRPNRFEGMTYIPPESPNYPDHLAIVTSNEPSLPGGQGSLQQRVLIVSRYGNVDASFQPQYPTLGPDGILPDYEPIEIGGIAYQASVLVCGESSILWKMDFDGNVVGNAIAIPDETWFEGVSIMPDGNIIATDGYRKVWAFSPDLTPLSNLTRDVTIGLGINPSALAWNNDTGRFLMMELTGMPNTLWSVSPTFAGKSLFANLDNIVVEPKYLVDQEKGNLRANRFYGLVYRDDVEQIALSYYNQSTTINNETIVPSRTRIVSFSDLGQLVNYQHLEDYNTTMVFSPSMLSYIPPGTGESSYVLRGASPELKTLKLVSPAEGTLRETIDLAPGGVSGISAVEYFNETPGDTNGRRFLILANGYRAVVADYSGSVVSDFNYREKLGILTPGDLAYISTGTYAGAFATIANSGNEIVIFRLDNQRVRGK